MSDEEFSPIRPKSVPLSHAQTPSPQQPESRHLAWLSWAFGGILAVAVTLLVFVVVPGLVEPAAVDPLPVPAPAASVTEPVATQPAEPDSAPFAELLRQQAREKAQEELGRFVELQLRLEESMQVGSWGQVEYDGAKAVATRGDEEFLEERFDEALASYGEAGEALAALIDLGEGLLSEALREGATALDQRDQETAQSRFEFALTIDPDNTAAREGLSRAAVLPEVIAALRQAKNHELAGDWQLALDTYQQVQALDPATAELADMLGAARAGVRDAEVRRHLSTGFAAMDSGRLDAAKRAFNAALALEPGHPVALGGLEQVAMQTDLSKIETLQNKAHAAEREERWQRAIADYDAVLALDPNIQFAKDGKIRASARLRTVEALKKIISAPDKLSSTRLFDEAKNILVRAERLSPRGAQLAENINAVKELITIYSTPVEVTFHSDNETRITLSTIGVLGSFDEKRVTLRPGAYTVIGSRRGCRDVRESIVVRPDMSPVDIRCTETF